MHSTFGFVIFVTGECPTNDLYKKIDVCKNKASISVIPLSQKF